MDCSRCEAMGRTPKKATHEVIGPNGIKSRVCNKCFKEIQNYTEVVGYANEED